MVVHLMVVVTKGCQIEGYLSTQSSPVYDYGLKVIYKFASIAYKRYRSWLWKKLTAEVNQILTDRLGNASVD